MVRRKKNNKKELRERISIVMMIYLDGLSEKKKEKLRIYLQKKMGNLVDYYFSLLKRKEREHLVLPQLLTKNKTVVINGRENGKAKKLEVT